MHNAVELMGKESILKLIAKFTLPSILAMIVHSIYNVVDRIFVGQYIGEYALAGITAAFPIMFLIIAIGSLIATGTATLISIRLGEQKEAEAANIFGNMIIISTILSVILSLLVIIFLEEILALFGATPEITPYMIDYLFIIFIATPLMNIIGFSLNSILRSEGRPNLAMQTMIASALANIVLDYIFIAKFNWGIQGAAWATVIGIAVGFLWMAMYYFSGKSVLKINKKCFKLDFTIIKNIMAIGSAAFFTNLGTCLALLFFNASLLIYGSNAAMTAMGAISGLYSLFIMPMVGIQIGIQPLISYNYGAKLWSRVQDTFIYSVAIATAFATVVFLVIEIWPKAFLVLFINENSATMPMAIEGLRILFAMLPLVGFQLLSVSYFQAISKPKEAVILGTLRQFLFLAPAIYILPKLFGLTGTWLATPVADLLAFLLSLVYIMKEFKNAKLD